MDKKQQAEVVVYHLRSHSSGIQEKIDTALREDIIENQKDMSKLIEYLVNGKCVSQYSSGGFHFCRKE